MAENSIAKNVAEVQERIAAAARRAGRNAREIRLIAVSKTHSAEAIRAAFAAGVQHFGENRVQEWEAKHKGLSTVGAQWHLVGHLQSNKAARAARLFDSVDSVDDADLAERLNRARGEMNVPEKLRVLIEVRVAREESKSGVEIADSPGLAARVAALNHLDFAGLMCIPPYCENPAEARSYFQRLRELRDQLSGRLSLELPVLSMGMSHDFEVAIEEGATEVRIGTALFGERGKV